MSMKNSTNEQMPVLKDFVYVSTGAKLLGGIVIGERCIVGANSVVINSFNQDSVIVGIPAKQAHKR